MLNYTQRCNCNLSDAYTLMYGFIGKKLIEELGMEGEAALREGSRQYGYDRGETARNKHIAVGAKVNMQSLFSLFHDLPADPRFRRELQQLIPTERVSHTLVCPMANIWAEYGQKKIGRIYCEEFHPACYCHYAYDYARLNLSKTLTQDGDNYCDFNVVLRPESLPDELKPICFEEYDPDYVKPEIVSPPVDGKVGFATLSIKLFYYLFRQAKQDLGDAGVKAVRDGLAQWADEMSKLLTKRAAEANDRVDGKYVSDNIPFEMNTGTADSELWKSYSDCGASEEVEEYFCKPLAAKLGI